MTPSSSETLAPKRAAIYARVSTVDKGQDPETQLRPLRDYASARGWEVVREYVDHMTGSTTSRPGLDRLVHDADQGEFDVVAVWAFDRWGRNTRHLLDTLDHFKAQNVDFVSVSQSIDTSTPMGRLVFTFIAALAAFERDLIQERVLLGIARARAQGKCLTRPRIEIDVDAARALVAGGMSIAAAARALKCDRCTLARRLKEGV